MNRRHFLTAGCIGAIVGAPLAMPAQSQSDPVFKTIGIDVSGNKIFCRRYGHGPAILMVHGFPRTSLMWRFLAPKLAANHSVVCVDLRAYGRSGIPPAGEDHFAYSKRAMANELIEVMAKLGFSTFTLIGHDRGGRVACRMALDHPKNVERCLRCNSNSRSMEPIGCIIRPDLLAVGFAVAEATAAGDLLARRSGSGLS
jgi:pimeloyl-ACP methyl ester carboxylesterase